MNAADGREQHGGATRHALARLRLARRTLICHASKRPPTQAGGASTSAQRATRVHSGAAATTFAGCEAACVLPRERKRARSYSRVTLVLAQSLSLRLYAVGRQNLLIFCAHIDVRRQTEADGTAPGWPARWRASTPTCMCDELQATTERQLNVAQRARLLARCTNKVHAKNQRRNASLSVPRCWKCLRAPTRSAMLMPAGPPSVPPNSSRSLSPRKLGFSAWWCAGACCSKLASAASRAASCRRRCQRSSSCSSASMDIAASRAARSSSVSLPALWQALLRPRAQEGGGSGAAGFATGSYVGALPRASALACAASSASADANVRPYEATPVWAHAPSAAAGRPGSAFAVLPG